MERAKELGVKEFARKPINFDEFSKVVMRMVEHWVEPGVNGAVAK